MNRKYRKKTGRTLPACLASLALVAMPASASDIAQGRELYQRHCAMCHGQGGSPSVAGAADFKRGEGLMQSDRALLEHIQKGKRACPSHLGVMSEQEIYAVIAYVRSLF